MSPDRRRALWQELGILLIVIWLPLFVSGWLGREMPRERDAGTLIYAMAQFIGGGVLILYLLKRHGESWRHLGLRRCRWWSELLWAIPIYIAAWLTYIAVWRWLDLVLGPDVRHSPSVLPHDPLSKMLIPFTFLLGAFFEEVFVRGYLWDRIRRLTGSKGFALVASSAFFALYHPYQVRGLVYIFAFGLVFGLFFWKGRSLPRLILAHTLFNLSIFFWARGG